MSGAVATPNDAIASGDVNTGLQDTTTSTTMIVTGEDSFLQEVL